MARVHWGEIAHVFVGGALAAPPALLAWVFAVSFTANIPGGLNWWALVVLAAVSVGAIAAVAASPVVRPAEIALARVLLGVALPEAADPRARTPRLLGAAWALLVALLGAVVALLVLYVLPLGVGLAMLPFQGVAEARVPGGPAIPVPPWPASLLLLPLGVVLALAALAVVPAVGLLQARLAPLFLGPSDADRLAASEARADGLARANHLARDLHDSLGHALTAITIQADAVERLATRDPPAAAASAKAIGDAARTALESLDDALAQLRRGPADDAPAAASASDPSIGRVLAESGRLLRLTSEVDAVPAGLRGVVARVLREALTNAARHGAGSAEVRVTSGDAVVVRVSNPVASTPWPVVGGRGLAGLRETVTLAGGTLEAGPSEGLWILTAILPFGDGRRAAGRAADARPTGGISDA